MVLVASFMRKFPSLPLFIFRKSADTMVEVITTARISFKNCRILVASRFTQMLNPSSVIIPDVERDSAIHWLQDRGGVMGAFLVTNYL
jgi:hypothetical protein